MTRSPARRRTTTPCWGGQANDVINLTDPGTPRDDLGLLDNRMGFTGGGNDFGNGNLGNDTIFAGDGNERHPGRGRRRLPGGQSGGSNTITGGMAMTRSSPGRTTIDAAGNDVVGMDSRRFVVHNRATGTTAARLLDVTASDAATIDGGRQRRDHRVERRRQHHRRHRSRHDRRRRRRDTVAGVSGERSVPVLPERGSHHGRGPGPHRYWLWRRKISGSSP